MGVLFVPFTDMPHMTVWGVFWHTRGISVILQKSELLGGIGNLGKGNSGYYSRKVWLVNHDDDFLPTGEYELPCYLCCRFNFLIRFIKREEEIYSLHGSVGFYILKVLRICASNNFHSIAMENDPLNMIS